MNGASKFIVNDYFIYMTIAISYNYNKGTELSNRLLRGRSAKKCLLVKLPHDRSFETGEIPARSAMNAHMLGLRRLRRLWIADRNR